MRAARITPGQQALTAEHIEDFAEIAGVEHLFHRRRHHHFGIQEELR